MEHDDTYQGLVTQANLKSSHLILMTLHLLRKLEIVLKFLASASKQWDLTVI
jgi:hypothetical protein